MKTEPLQPKHLLKPLAVTPDDFGEISKFCEHASTPADAIIAVFMTLNLIAKYLEEGVPVFDEGESEDGN